MSTSRDCLPSGLILFFDELTTAVPAVSTKLNASGATAATGISPFRLETAAAGRSAAAAHPDSGGCGFERIAGDLENTTIVTQQNETGDDLVYQRAVIGSALTLFAVFTIAGNALVMIAVAREPCLRATITNYFIVSLAVADLIIGVVVMPFSIVLETTDGWWPFGADWCDVWHSIDVLASTASILNLSVIALDRYWAITDPISYPTRMSAGRAVVFVGLVWICSAAISFPAIAWWRHSAPTSTPATATVDDLDDGSTSKATCSFTEDSAYLVLSSLISFYFPVSVILFAYYRIYSAAAAQMRSIERGSKVLQSSSSPATSNGVDRGETMTLRIHRGGCGSRTGSGVIRGMCVGVGSTSLTSRRTVTSSFRNADFLENGGGDHCSSRSRDACTIQPHGQLPMSSTSVAGGSTDDLPQSASPNHGTSSPSHQQHLQQQQQHNRRWKTLTVCRRRLTRVARERKAAKTLGIVMGVFCACWVPFFVTNFLYGLCGHDCVMHADTLFRVFAWLGYINSGMNPVIYACSMRDFRRAFARRLCGCRWCPASVGSAAGRRGYGCRNGSGGAASMAASRYSTYSTTSFNY